jgi:hypothetical protein
MDTGQERLELCSETRDHRPHPCRVEDIVANPEHHRGAVQEADYPHIATYRQISSRSGSHVRGSRPTDAPRSLASSRLKFLLWSAIPTTR